MAGFVVEVDVVADVDVAGFVFEFVDALGGGGFRGVGFGCRGWFRGGGGGLG